MKAMDVTLDVSKLSGWLNADAYCRESKGGHTVRASLGELRVGGGKVAGAGGASSALTKGSVADWGHRHGEERTWNISFMVVTLDVSKLSGWLNADAYCRESEGGHIRCGARCLAWGGRVARAGRRCTCHASMGGDCRD